MDYENLIFISYRRADPDWVRWTRENFVRALSSLLRPALGDVGVFLDGTIETGASWPHRLATSLARSKILVPVLSRDYFYSEWCRLELALMLHREELLGLRTASNPDGLVLPVIIDDGDCFPPEVQAIQGASIHEFANPFIRPDSPKQEALAEYLRTRFCPDVERVVDNIPPYDPAWESITYERFRNTFQVQIRSQNTLPGLTLGETS